MSYPVNQFININVRISSAGLATANFGSAVLFATKEDAITEKVSSLVDKIKTYYTIQSVAEDFKKDSEVYTAAAIWFGGAPALPELKIFVRNDQDSTWAETLNKARNLSWWYWTFVTAPVYEQPNDVEAIAQWCEQNSSYFMNCQSGTSANAIRDESKSDDIASVLTAKGLRHVTTCAHASDAYSGIYLAKPFAIIDFSSPGSTITGEYKKSSGLQTEDLKDSEYASMKKDTKKCAFYTTIELQGSTDSGRWINTQSHSTYGEMMDDVINLDAFVNALMVNIYNTIANQPTKLPQTPVGQSLVNSAAREIGEQYIKNNYLGERTYLDPADGQEKHSLGYVLKTKPEDILTLSDSERAKHKCAPINMLVFRAGSILGANITVDVY